MGIRTILLSLDGSEASKPAERYPINPAGLPTRKEALTLTLVTKAGEPV